MPRVELNKSAPNFTLEDFSGKAVSLSDFKGESNILLVFDRGFV